MSITTTPEAVINAAVAEKKAATLAEIADITADITAEKRPSWLSTSAENLQREVAFLNALEEIEFDFANIDEARQSGLIDNDQSALIRKLFLLTNFLGNIALRRSSSTQVVEGQVSAAKQIARVVADVSRDLSRGVPL